VGFVVTVLCAAALQQLHVEPYPGEVGEPVTVTAANEAGPLSGLELHVELPDGSERPIGITDANGRLEYLPAAVGQHVFLAGVDGTRILAPHRVVAPQRRWWIALGTVPVGLALLWQLSRARGRRGP
jgi:hypothetical protein